MADQVAPYSYDQIPYASFSFPQTHPDRLATIATLLGMSPSPVERCRVLELGCAAGGNLIPMAQGLPGSEFIGIDLSTREIAQGQVMLATLGLTNITLRYLDLLDVTADFGQFDYIIAHGIYSWVPPVVQDKILEICRQNLALNGVAYISYNTYPGWRLHSTIRDMMLYHTRQVTDPEERITQARALLDFLAESVQAKSSAHASFLHSYVHYVKERFLPKDDGYLFHNELAEVNEPVYFYQFAEHAAQHGLKYLADAQFQTMLASNLPAEVVTSLRQMAKDTIALEQYLDFLRNRPFRQSLLCHQEIRLQSKLPPERLAEFYLASSALPDQPEPDLHSTVVEKFRVPNGATFSTDHPLTKAAILHLTEIWPQAISFDSLLVEASTRLNGSAAPAMTSTGGIGDREIVGANLLKAYGYSDDLLELHVYAPHFVLDVSERPIASPVARLQIKNDSRVTNVRHEIIKLEGLSCHLLPYLDGTRNRTALLDLLENWIMEGMIETELPKDKEQIRNALPDMLEPALQLLANAALLLG